ncbi:MAG: ATP-dependent RNA helicase HrpA [Gammaproteobacteria bacterium]|nr:ATP-dependent RNA helicase HrpA [Gammaproteobacteria bacterium]
MTDTKQHKNTKHSSSSRAFDLKNSLSLVLTSDVGRLIGLERKIARLKSQNKPFNKLLEKLRYNIEQSISKVKQRAQSAPKVTYPEALPVSQRTDEIKKLIEKHQVLILAGETGSGKTTQLPKICIEAGLANRGQIAHTQPRRVAATSVAARIAEELNVNLGTEVGVSVRFLDKSSKDGYLKVMTDGMLLAEMQHDPMLSHYQVVIIDEAHERSINIDFLMGLLKPLLQKRRDLKLIVTSATIDLERFSKFFDNAPIITVEGRTYPVDMQYRPLDPNNSPGNEPPELWQIGQCVKEAEKQGPGDILIFLPGEGEIRQTARYLRKLSLRQVEVLPLYARLSISEQQKVFKTSNARKIVLATNVAETSLTVPGIRYVIDPGTARISRFSMRSKIQRLQVEKISQASANQRAGRCGRVSAGICYRLYEETDYLSRSEFTLPEIKRTNLASVILQMKMMGIKQPEEFPFIENAEEKHWRDGFNLLFELGALDQNNELTELGRSIAKWPLDPKLAVMIYSGRKTALNEMLVLASLYSVRDPRDRPHDKAQKADEAHAQWDDKKSDFVSFLNLWRDLHKQQEDRTNRDFKQFCKDNFISFPAWLDWRNTYRQLKQILSESGFKISKTTADYDQVHQALLPALLSNVMTKTNDAHYLGARNTRVFIHPSSVNFKNKSQWLMAGELIETGKLYARATAPIEAEWIDAAAEHLVKVSYLDPHWRKKKGEACAFMQKSLFGLIYLTGKLVGYSSEEPALSRKWLIEKGLIDGELITKAPFHSINQKRLDEYRDEETRQRRTDIIKSDEELIDFFEQRLPANISNVKQLERWLKKDWKGNNKNLTLTDEDIVNPNTELDETAFPKVYPIRDSELALEYRFEPGHSDDGVSFCIPLAMLKQFQPKDFEWLVPGLLEEKILSSIKALPKAVRKNFIPAPEFAQACFQRMKERFREGDFFQELATNLYQISGKQVDIELWKDIELPAHLVPNFKVYGDSKKPVEKGRSLEGLQNKLSADIKKALTQPVTSVPVQDKANASNKPSKQAPTELKLWPDNFNFELEVVNEQRQQKSVILQAFKDLGESVKIQGCESKFIAEKTHRRGVARLILLALENKKKYFVRSWHSRKALTKLATLLEPYPQLVDDVCMAVINKYLPESPVESYSDYQHTLQAADDAFNETTNEALSLLLDLLTKTQEISKTVYEKVEPKFIQSYMDIRQQLDDLWFAGCVYKHGLDRMQDYSRYLSGLEKRMERMSINFPREEQSLREFKAIERRVNSLPDSPHNKEYNAVKDELFWMLQEFRISVFAQGIKTAYPISVKRIEKQMEQLKYLN